jgi:hypothetical protein
MKLKIFQKIMEKLLFLLLINIVQKLKKLHKYVMLIILN